MSSEFNILRPWESLDGWQKEYIECEQDCFLMTGRQCGKSAAMSIKAGERAIRKPNRDILIIALTEKQAYQLFFKVLNYLSAKYPSMIMKGKDKPTKHEIKLKNKSVIRCYATGLNGFGLRGFTITDLFVDECREISREVFTSITPMLSVTKGTIDVGSTPGGKEGYFFECSKPDSGFKRFFQSAEDCPRVSKEHLERERKRMTALEYAQEHLAQFLDEFRRIFNEQLLAACFKDSVRAQTDKYLGVDVARYGGDKNAFVICSAGEDKYYINSCETTERKGINETYSKILQLEEQNNFKKILVDDAGVGGGLTDFLIEKFRSKIVGINNASRPIEAKTDGIQKKKRILKEDLYSNTLMLMEQGALEMAYNDELHQSLASMMFEYNERGQVIIYGKNNHLAEALVRALWGARKKALNIWVSYTGDDRLRLGQN